MNIEKTTAKKLFDTIITQYRIKNDAQLARDLKVAPPVICKMRSGHLPVGATMILSLHLRYGMPAIELMALANMPNKFAVE